MVARSDGRQDFASEIGKSGIAKASHFMVTMTVPTNQPGVNLRNKIGQDFSSNAENFVEYSMQGFSHLCFRIERINLPGRIILTSPYKEGNIGLVSEYPTNVAYQPVDFTLVLSEDYSEKIFFELWQDCIIGSHRTKGDVHPDGGVKELNYHANYTCTMLITAFSDAVGRRREMQPVYECVLNEAYPRTIQDMQADWGSQEIQRLNVVFDYKYYKDKIHYEVDKRFATDGRRRFGRSTARTGIEQGAAVLAGQVAARSGLTQRQQAFLTGATTAAVNIFKVGGNLAGGGGAVSRTTSTSVRDAFNRNRVDVFTV